MIQAQPLGDFDFQGMFSVLLKHRYAFPRVLYGFVLIPLQQTHTPFAVRPLGCILHRCALHLPRLTCPRLTPPCLTGVSRCVLDCSASLGRIWQSSRWWPLLPLHGGKVTAGCS